MPSRRFFNRSAQLSSVSYPQDASGGSLPTPGSSVTVPCAIQQSSPPERGGKDQLQTRAVATIEVLFGPAFAQSPAAALAAIRALKARDLITLDDDTPVVADGPAFDQSGRGVVYQINGLFTT